MGKYEWEEVFAAMRGALQRLVKNVDASAVEEIQETGLDACEIEGSMCDHFDWHVDSHEQTKNEEKK